MTGTRPLLSCALPPSADITSTARLAEALGYHRVWVFESPAVYGDTWIALARIAEATTEIGLGTGVTIPGFRHPVVTASAIATVDELAPGRLVVAVGTGYTSRSTIGQPPVTWTALAGYVRQVRALLDGELVEIDGRPCQLLHPPGFAPARPVGVPVWVAAGGPKGVGVARELNAPGLLVTTVPAQPNGFTEVAVLRCGTVLDPGEDHTSPRVVEAAGPVYASIVHARWEYGQHAAVDATPGGPQWRAALEAARPAGERHLAVHEGHLRALTDRDRDLVTAGGDAVLRAGWVGPPAAIRDRFDQAAAAGVTEIIYVPAGPDPHRELTAFAAAAQPSRGIGNGGAAV